MRTFLEFKQHAEEIPESLPVGLNQVPKKHATGYEDLMIGLLSRNTSRILE